MTPTSNIYLCANTNLNLRATDYDTIYFATESAKRTWFASKTVRTLNDQMYTRIGNSAVGSSDRGGQYTIIGRNRIKVMLPFGQVNTCDYLYFINPSYENKYYYCFITDIQYVNDATTEIEYEEDVFMTWCNDMQLGYSFVRRESVSRDYYFEARNEVEDYGINSVYHTYYRGDIGASYTQANQFVCVCTNELLSGNGDVKTAITTSGGVDMTFKDINDFSMNCGKPDNLLYYIANLSSQTACSRLSKMILNANAENIISVFPVPRICIPGDAYLSLTSTSTMDTIAIVTSSGVPVNSRPQGTLAIEFQTFHYSATARTALFQDYDISTMAYSVFDNTAMRNRKMYNSPYCNIRVVNNYGGYIDLNPQMILNAKNAELQPANIKIQFILKGSLFLSPKVQLTVAYDGFVDNPNYKLDLVPQPSLPITSDVAQEWYRQNVLGETINMTMGLARLGGGLALSATGAGTMVGIGMAASGLAEVGSYASNIWKVEHLPMSTTGGSDAGIGARSFGLDKFTIEFQSVDKQVAIDIDNYFTKYGYRVEQLKDVPFGLNGRSRFYYVQTDNLTIKGNVPAYAKAGIKRLYDKGIRLWSAEHFLDYSAGNLLTT